MVDDFVDPYLDPATGLLRNRLGATTQEALDKAELVATSIRNMLASITAPVTRRPHPAEWVQAELARHDAILGPTPGRDQGAAAAMRSLERLALEAARESDRQTTRWERQGNGMEGLSR